MTALHLACEAGETDLVQYIVRNCNPDVDVVSKVSYLRMITLCSLI